MAGDRKLYKTLWAVHSWTGLYIGLIVAILSVSGSAVVFQDEIDSFLNGSLLHVEPANGRASLTAIADRILARYDEGYSMNVIRLPESDDAAIQVDLVHPRPEGIEIRQVLVNPYTGAVIGDRDYTRTLAYYLRHLHVRGFQATYGRQFVGIFGVALLVSTVTGFFIYGNFMRSMTFGQIRWAQGIRVIAADWHKAVGILALLFNFVIAVTGAWLGWSNEALKLARAQPDGGIPYLLAQAKRKMTPRQDAAIRVDYDAVMEAAQRAIPGFEPRSLNLTRDGRGQVVIFGKPAGAIYAGSSDKVLIDKATHSVTAAFTVQRSSPGSKLYYIAEPLHFGSFAGIPLKIAYCVFGLAAGVLSITGFLVYWKRTQKPSGSKASPSTVARLILWSTVIGGALVLLAGASVTIGPLIPSVTVSILTVLWPVWFAARYGIRTWRTARSQRVS